MEPRSDVQEIKCYKVNAEERCMFSRKENVDICVIFGCLPQHHVSAKNCCFK